MAPTDLHYDPALVANFTRLLSDAAFLRNHNRHSSAYALGIIGLEEIAKDILARWSKMHPEMPIAKRRNEHLTKQAAIACLLVAEHIAPSYDDMLSKRDKSRDWMSDDRFRVDEAFMWRAHDSEIQKAKHLALYYDLSDASGTARPVEFTGEQVDDLIANARRAVMLTADHKALTIAFALFQVLKDSPKTER